MEMDEKLTKELFQKAKALGADLVSACSVKQVEEYPRAKEEIDRIDPEAKSILVFAIRMVSSSIAQAEKNIRIAQFSTRLLYEELARVCFGLMKELDEKGFHASPIPTYLPVPMEPEGKGLIAELSLRHIAYEAGLGSIGKSRLLVTPEFGPRVRLGAIVTDAPLTAGKRFEKDFCTDCDLCIEACPSESLHKEGQEAIMLCARHHLRYGLPGLIRFAIRLIKAESDDEKIKMVRSPEFWEYWQNLNTGIFYYCYNCLNACPVGK
jgi:epoxyqueuosine reductase